LKLGASLTDKETTCSGLRLVEMSGMAWRVLELPADVRMASS
jgi:hypothetical protein